MPTPPNNPFHEQPTVLTKEANSFNILSRIANGIFSSFTETVSVYFICAFLVKTITLYIY